MGPNLKIVHNKSFQMIGLPELVLSGPTTPSDASQTLPVPEDPKGTIKGLVLGKCDSHGTIFGLSFTKATLNRTNEVMPCCLHQ